MRLSRELVKLREGSATFGEFASATSKDWRAMADYLLRRWRVPDGVERSDVEQELLTGAWLYVRSWDPDRGVPLDRYVAWNASIRAKKWIHRQRGAKRRSDDAPSRHPLAHSRVFAEGSDIDPEELVSVEAEQHRAAEMQEAIEQAKAKMSAFERACLELVVEHGSASTAAVKLYADTDLCLAGRWGSQADARRALGMALADMGRGMMGGT